MHFFVDKEKHIFRSLFPFLSSNDFLGFSPCAVKVIAIFFLLNAKAKMKRHQINLEEFPEKV